MRYLIVLVCMLMLNGCGIVTHLKDNRMISGHGVIVDQYGEPVKGVRVEYEVKRWGFGFMGTGFYWDGRDYKHYPGLSQSDASGRFVVRKWGTELQLKKLEREGFFVYGFSGMRPQPQFWPIADIDADSPLVIQAWKFSNSKPSTQKVEEKYFERLQINNSEHRFAFRQGELTFRLSESNPESGEIDITLKSDNGAFRKFDAYLPAIAPKTGYQATVSFGITQRKWPQMIQIPGGRRANFSHAQNLYFRSNRGEVAHLRVYSQVKNIAGIRRVQALIYAASNLDNTLVLHPEHNRNFVPKRTNCLNCVRGRN